jgi:threonine/homoserine/homoserine lactone efflux protein
MIHIFGRTIDFDSAFFILFGLFCFIMGLLNKGQSFTSSFQYDGLKKTLGSKYNRVMNIGWGLIFIVIGLLLIKRN